ncbi:MAG: hypothetical protein ACKOEI_06805, partial [Chthoniobacterales bacterium]
YAKESVLLSVGKSNAARCSAGPCLVGLMLVHFLIYRPTLTERRYKKGTIVAGDGDATWAAKANRAGTARSTF